MISQIRHKPNEISCFNSMYQLVECAQCALRIMLEHNIKTNEKKDTIPSARIWPRRIIDLHVKVQDDFGMKRSHRTWMKMEAARIDEKGERGFRVLKIIDS